MNDTEKIWNIDSLKEYLLSMIEHQSTLIANNDKRYTEQFNASKEAVAAALAAQKELTNAAFTSSEKAIVKAEDSQRTYNQGHNDLSRKMEEQYKLMVPLTEHKADMINIEKRADRQSDDIKSLRESRSGNEGKGTGMNSLWAIAIGAIVVLCSLVGAFIGILNYLKK